MESSQKNNSFNFHNNVTLRIKGDGGLSRYLQFQYEHFRDQPDYSDSIDSCVDLICKENSISPDILLKNGSERYGIDKNTNKFFWTVGTSSILLDGNKKLFEQRELFFDKTFNNMKANSILDLILRLHFIASKFVLVHAAAVSKNGKGLLLPAWKSMGKTATCLKLVENGYDYLGDDKVWLNNKSEILANPRYVVLKDSNINHFPELISFSTRVKLILKSFIMTLKIWKKSFLVQKITKRYINVRPIHKYIGELYPTSTTLNKTTISKLLYIIKSEQSKNVNFENIDKEEVIENLIHIGNVEWNYDLLFLASAHDILFPLAPRWTDEINNLTYQENQILRKTFSKTSSSQVKIPADEKDMSWKAFIDEVEKL